jgi:hypothetical protein
VGLLTPAARRFRAFLDGLPGAQLDSLARAYAAAAREQGAYVIKPDGTEVPIPPILTPSVVPRERMTQASADAHLLVTGLQRLTASLMEDPAREPLRRRLFGAFTPLEAEGLRTTWRAAGHLAVARVDYLVDIDGRPRALEVNSTIPAMQGYSDGIAAAFLREVSRFRGLSGHQAARLIDDNGRNTDDLLASLIAHYERLGGKPRQWLAIAIVARDGDAQRGELLHYVKRWCELGYLAWLATPADCRIVDGKAVVSGRAPDLIYRHIFARRLEPGSDFARMCLEPERFRVLNPIASHLEVKGMVGLLSAAAYDEHSPLDEAQRDAARRALPWTRVLDPVATVGPGGEPIADLAAWTRAHGHALVLKRSWDYGGKSVFLGAELDDDATQARLRSIIGEGGGSGPRTWDDLCDFALRDGDAWVVQELVHADKEPHLRADPQGVHARDLYVDLSAYANTGVAARPTGGAVRAAESRIVNILGGGGVAPLVRESVLESLLS